ncbi:hypothetical protein [Acetobacter cerevisiae]|uniref:Uncharacterized protein n=1 Tax=Acetobacter cerevisiae TaxID=178900 RepID=A0ABT1EUV1_9PROT|nr:hypothetical protein [Acetobacter cerevisiae]MCP1247049.1 hypothetical protein [Acetobacter cerevisiae]MCP1256602.1 hypothetical protein [Acetobacter cerevisiae]
MAKNGSFWGRFFLWIILFWLWNIIEPGSVMEIVSHVNNFNSLQDNEPAGAADLD